MVATKRKRPLKSLSQGRPPILAKPPSTLSSRATRTLIRTYHTLEKRRSAFLASGDTASAAAITAQIAAQGGIAAYQACSLQGQDLKRGGDSSHVLMEWLSDFRADLKAKKEGGEAYRLLEVGALSEQNACSKSGVFEIERIDLNSQSKGILQQDFMERPLPTSPQETFDVISLSLVLNYVPDAKGKGDMLKRTLSFLRYQEKSEFDEMDGMFPCLFLVLPLSCVTNSRYMDEERLEAIMGSLGYRRVQRKVSNKLVYYLWWKGGKVEGNEFAKVELKPGGKRNNFAIVMK